MSDNALGCLIELGALLGQLVTRGDRSGPRRAPLLIEPHEHPIDERWTIDPVEPLPPPHSTPAAIAARRAGRTCSWPPPSERRWSWLDHAISMIVNAGRSIGRVALAVTRSFVRVWRG